ncbi:8841_t:CDS:2, partial [Acaulospora morrowiae]
AVVSKSSNTAVDIALLLLEGCSTVTNIVMKTPKTFLLNQYQHSDPLPLAGLPPPPADDGAGLRIPLPLADEGGGLAGRPTPG